MESAENPGSRLLVIFDGHCALCNRTVRWLIARDQRSRLRFAASDSLRVAGLLQRHATGEPGSLPAPTTILVLRNAGTPAEQVLWRSDAIVVLLAELPQPWPAVGAALGWIPRPLRDLGYRFIARWRYRIWGQLESCPLPTDVERDRFL